MKKLLYLLPLFFLTACGDSADEQTKEPVSLETDKDKLSYAFGAMDAKKILESNPNASRLNKEKLIEGYNEGFREGVSKDPNGPEITALNNLFGVQGTDFDTVYVDEGSRAYGLLQASMFFESLLGVNEVEAIDKAKLVRGFEDGLYQVDTVMTKQEQMTAIEVFSKQVQERMMAEQAAKMSEVQAVEAAQWENIKAMDGIEELANGVYLKTVKKGSGKKPAVTDDVEASYVLSDLNGNVQQRSSDFGETFKTNLQGVVQGWQIGFQEMQVGGKYMLYVPPAMGYGKETLVFEIEVFDIGPAGTIAPPRR